jgi:hypothetical protein
MKRWQQERKIAYREWKKHRRLHVETNRYRNRVGVSAYIVDCECDEQEIKSEILFREWLRELQTG